MVEAHSCRQQITIFFEQLSQSEVSVITCARRIDWVLRAEPVGPLSIESTLALGVDIFSQSSEFSCFKSVRRESH